MPAEEDISVANALMSPGMAAALQTGYSTAMQARDDLMTIDRGMPEDTIMVKVTAVTGGLYSWTEQIRDTTGARVDKSNGRTGTDTSYPAYDPNSFVTTFPWYGYIRRAGWVTSLKGPIYEVVGGSGSGSAMTLIGVSTDSVSLSTVAGSYSGTLKTFTGLASGTYMLWGKYQFAISFAVSFTAEIDMQASLTLTSATITPSNYRVSQHQFYGTGGGGTMFDTITIASCIQTAGGGDLNLEYTYSYNAGSSSVAVESTVSLWKIS